MKLERGTEITHYSIVDKIGEGGMGEVWRATDRKLGRDVAIKVLPHELAGEPERLARFEREAQVLASLNHPNIAAIYGLDQVGDTRFLVLELVEGEELATRLLRGPVPPEEALRIARQIADALETAHEQGIVHRDLKPANVKVTADGKVKVLDFGLAKALLTGPAGESDMSRSPTITSLATRTGVILGTAAYMSPEQARGHAVDKRADIWAFGCVLLELLTGGNPFLENTVSDTLASILRSEPDWKRVPVDVPRGVRHLLRRCLEKDPRKRLRDIGEARVAIDAILAGEGVDGGAAPDAAPGAKATGSFGRLAATAAGAVALTAIATVAIVRAVAPPPPAPEVRRFEVLDGPFQYSAVAPPQISPDGRTIVFSREDGLWVRRLDQLEPLRLDGTEAATKPTWTPDSATIVFVANEDLKSVPAGGGTATTIAIGVGDVSSGGGLTCSPDGRVAYANGNQGISEIPLRGGDTRVILAPDGATEADFHEPSFLPDGSLMFVIHRAPEGADTIALLADGERKILLRIDSQVLQQPAYSPTGHIVFHRGGSRAGLWAVPFSLERHETTGEPFLITTDGNHPSVAVDGTLTYVRGAGGGLRQLTWVERDGTVQESVGPTQSAISAPALSPDGTRVAVMASEGEVGNIWVYDIARGTRTRLSFGTSLDWDPAWLPDGETVVFWEGQTRALSRKPADGTGDAVRLMARDLLDSGVPAFSSDGRWMVFWVKPDARSQDVWLLDLASEGADPTPLLDSDFIEDNPRISPDDRFLAYASDESGRREVYLTRFPDAAGKWQVSVEGGTFPVWSPVGGELFYLQGTMLMAVDVTTSPALRLGTPRALFDASEHGIDVQGHSRYDVSRDGRRFLMIRGVREGENAPGLVINYAWDVPFRD